MNLTLQPTVLRWGRERADLSADLLAAKVTTRPDRVIAWEQTG